MKLLQMMLVSTISLSICISSLDNVCFTNAKLYLGWEFMHIDNCKYNCSQSGYDGMFLRAQDGVHCYCETNDEYDSLIHKWMKPYPHQIRK